LKKKTIQTKFLKTKLLFIMEGFSFLTDTNGINCDSVITKSLHFTNLETEHSTSHIDRKQKHKTIEQLSVYDKNGNSVLTSGREIEVIQQYKSSCQKLIQLIGKSFNYLFEQKGLQCQWNQTVNESLESLSDSDALQNRVDKLSENIDFHMKTQTHQSRIMFHHYHFVKSVFDYYYQNNEKEENICSTFDKASSSFVVSNPMIKLLSDHILYGEPIQALCLPLRQMNIQILDNRGYKKGMVDKKMKNMKVQLKSKKLHQSVNQDKLLRPFLSGVPFNPVYVLLNHLPDQKKLKNEKVKLCHIEEINAVKSPLKQEEDINHHIKQENLLFVSNPAKNIRYFINEKKYNDQSYFCNKKFIHQYEKLDFILPFDELTHCHRVPQTPFLFYDLKELSTNYVHTVMDKQKDPKKDARLYDRRFKLNMKTINKLFSKNDKKELKFIDSNFESYAFIQEVLKLVTGQDDISSFNHPDFIKKLKNSIHENYNDISEMARELAEKYESENCQGIENDCLNTPSPIKQVEYQDHDIWLKNVSAKQIKELNTDIATHDLECRIIKSKKKNKDLQLRMKRFEVDKTVKTLRSLGFKIDTNINHYRRLVIEYVKPDELYSMAKKIVNHELTLISSENNKKSLKDRLLEKYYNEPLKSSIINVLYDFGEIEYEEYKHYEKIMYFKGPSLSISQREQILDLFFWVHLSDYFFYKDSGEIVKIENQETREIYEKIYEQTKKYRIIFEYILYQYKLNGVRVRCINSYERTGENRGRNAKKRIRVFREERAYIYDQKYSKHIGITKDGIVVACKKKIDNQNEDVYLLNYTNKKNQNSNEMIDEKDEIKLENRKNQLLDTNIKIVNEELLDQMKKQKSKDQFDDIMSMINQVQSEDQSLEPPLKKIKSSSSQSSNDMPIEKPTGLDYSNFIQEDNDVIHDDGNNDDLNQNKRYWSKEQIYEDDMDFIRKGIDNAYESDEDLNILETSVMQMRTILFNKREFYDSQINILESLKAYFRMGHTYFQNITAKTKNFKSKIEKIANKLKNLTEKDQIENYDMLNDKEQIVEDLRFVKKLQDIVDQNFIKKQ